MNHTQLELLLCQWGDRRRRVQETVGLTAACPSYSRHLFAALHEDWSDLDRTHIEACSKCQEVHQNIANKLHPHKEDLDWYVAASDEEQRTDRFADLHHHVEVLGCKACLRRCDNLKPIPIGLYMRPVGEREERLAAAGESDESKPEDSPTIKGEKWSVAIFTLTGKGKEGRWLINVIGPLDSVGLSKNLAYTTGDSAETTIVSEPIRLDKNLDGTHSFGTGALRREPPDNAMLVLMPTDETKPQQAKDSTPETAEQLSDSWSETLRRDDATPWSLERESVEYNAASTLVGAGRSLGGQEEDSEPSSAGEPPVIRLHLSAEDPRIQWESGGPGDARANHLDVEVVIQEGFRQLSVHADGIACVEPGCTLTLRWLSDEHGTVNAEARLQDDDKVVLLDAETGDKAPKNWGPSHILEIRFDRTVSPEYSFVARVPIR